MGFGATATTLAAAQVDATTLVPVSKAGARNEIAAGALLEAITLVDANRPNKRLGTSAANATATMANLTGLSQPLIADREYVFECVLFWTNSSSVEGIRFDFDGGTVTAASFTAQGAFFNDDEVKSNPRSAALATDFTFTSITSTGVPYWVCRGSIVVSVGGTFIPRFAEENAGEGLATVLAGSYITFIDVT